MKEIVGYIDVLNQKLIEVCSTEEAAKRLKLSPRRLRAIAKNRGIGKKIGRDLFFREDELEKLKPRKTGRPKTIE